MLKLYPDDLYNPKDPVNSYMALDCVTQVPEEFFNRKPTGNRVLKSPCTFCSYKKACWGDNLQYLPQQQSKSKSPKWTWYTEVNNPRVDEFAPDPAYLAVDRSP